MGDTILIVNYTLYPYRAIDIALLEKVLLSRVSIFGTAVSWAEAAGAEANLYNSTADDATNCRVQRILGCAIVHRRSAV